MVRKEHLYLLHLWQNAEGKEGWRARVTNVRSQEVRYFKDLAALAAFVEGLRQEEGEGGDGKG